MRRAPFFVIIGPTAVGKTTLVEEMLERVPNSTRLVTCTSRPRRQGEVDGRDYHFLERDEFECRIDDGEFIEVNEYAENLYGSSRKMLDDLRLHYDVVFAILDVNGARNMKCHVSDAITVFIAPDSFADLERRVRARPGVTEVQVQKRLAVARRELEERDSFDVLILNRDGAFFATVTELEDLVKQKKEA